MPFQVSYSAKATPVGLITFFSAGEDQPAVCDGNVTMTAIIVGDLTGHTVLWEQLTGPAVTWTSPLNQLQVTYTVATFEDRSFRFYIDKDTAQEQSDDINIFGTPTDKTYFGLPDNNCLINFGVGLRCNAPDLVLGYEFPGDKVTAAACRTSNNPELFWTTDCETDDTLVQYIVQERTAAGAWNNEAVLPPTANRHTPLNPGATYRVVAVRLEINSVPSSTPSNSVYEDGLIGKTNDGVGAAVSTWTEIGSGNARKSHITIPTYSVSLVTLLACNPDAPEDFYIGSGNALKSHITIPTFTVDELFLISCDPDAPEDYYIGSGNALIRHITIPTYSVLDLTGGDIGG
jgi:hypothetical protein